MSGIFSTIKLWDVISDTWTGLRAATDGGSRRDIRLPKSSEADLNKVLAVTALDDDEIQLSYVSPSLLQGAQGIQGEQGVPGVNGANGNGLTYIGVSTPANAAAGDTWLKEIVDGNFKFNLMVQRIFDKWVSINRVSQAINGASITSNTIIRVPIPDGGLNFEAGSLLVAIGLRLYAFTNINANNKWVFSVGDAFYGQWGVTNFRERLVAELTQASSGWGSEIERNFYSEGVKIELLNASWIEIRVTKVGNPGPLWLHGNVFTSAIIQ
jgi:hypothetical protein